MFIWTIRTILVFSKTSSWYGKTLPKKRSLGKVTFWDYRENQLIHWGYILKSSPMLGCSRRGFYFWKTNISGILGHAHFRKKSIFLIFGTYLVRIWYVDGTWIRPQKAKKGLMRIILSQGKFFSFEELTSDGPQIGHDQLITTYARGCFLILQSGSK